MALPEPAIAEIAPASPDIPLEEQTRKAGHVVATGVFDLLHLGHVHFLRQAAKLGDRLTVIVAHDDTVRRLKREPVVPGAVRAELVAALKPVDGVVIGNPGDMLAVIDKLRPDLIVLGHDQRIFDPAKLEAKLADRGLTVKVLRLPKLEHGLAGTRKMIRRVLELYRHRLISE